jgi:predicted Zn-dependent protease
MSAPLSPQETVERVLALSKADGCVALTSEEFTTNLRWANNTLTTNGEMRSRQLAVVSVVNGAAGMAAGTVARSSFSPDLLEDLVRASEQAARDAGPADDAAALVEPYDVHDDWTAAPEATSVGVFSSFAADLGVAFDRARGAERLLFGFAEHTVTTDYLGTSTGIRRRHVQPSGKLEINGKSTDLARSVWFGQSTRDFTDVDVLGHDDELARRLDWARRTVEFAPGRYETLLPPTAVADLMIYLYWYTAARDADEGRSVFGKAGGGTRVGERLSAVPLTLRSDPAEPGLESLPFVATTSSMAGLLSVFDNGLPLGRTEWIADGCLTTLATHRAYAAKSDRTPSPLIDNLVLEGPAGGATLNEMIASSQRSLLVTSLWYTREVDDQTLLLTGLTRDGTYLVEGGEVVGAVTNFRWNDSPVDMFNRLTEVGRTERCLSREWSDYFTRTAMPTLRVADFNMSTVSQAS